MLDYIRGDRMKKIIFLLSTLITLLSFSYIDGRYTAIKKNGNNISELTLIYRNNKIISAAFDKKNSTGLSEKLTNKEFATKRRICYNLIIHFYFFRFYYFFYFCSCSNTRIC